MSLMGIREIILLMIMFVYWPTSALSTSNVSSKIYSAGDITTALLITLNDISANIIQLGFSIIIICSAYKLIRWIRTDDALLVFLFDVAGNDNKYNGKIISTLLVAELHRIELAIKSGLESVESKDPIVTSPILASDEKATMPQLGTVDVGKGSVSIGELMATAKYLFHGSGQKIIGSLEMNKSDTKLIAYLSGNQAAYWEVQTKNDSNDSVSELVRKLSYEIAFYLYQEHISTRTITGFTYWVEATCAYQKYFDTKEAKQLHISEDRCLRANGIESSYSRDIVYLFYLLGRAYYYEQNYEKSKEMLCKSLELSPYYSFAWNALSWTLMKQRSYKALQASERAISSFPYYSYELQNLGVEFPVQGSDEYNQNLASFWFTKGLVLSKQKQPQEAALTAFNEATRLNPKFARAWYCKSKALKDMPGKEKEAIEAHDKAIELDPGLAWYDKKMH